MLLPEAPKILSSIISLTPATASSRFSGIITPLPKARPSALITVGNSFFSLIYSIASFALSKTLYSAVGISYFCISSFEKTFEPSIIAAFARGPKVLNPASLSASTIPATSGSSGATTTKSTLNFLAKSTTPSISVAETSKHFASYEMPPLPGVQKISSTLLDSLIFLIRACSLPPPPTTRTFIISSEFIINM